MENVGSYLKREREMRNITLEELANQTKVSVFFLKSIEEDHYERLPGLTYAKGFLRAYADCIGLSHQDILLRFDTMLNTLAGNNNQQIKLELVKKRKRTIRIWGVVFLVSVATFMLYFLVKKYVL